MRALSLRAVGVALAISALVVLGRPATADAKLRSRGEVGVEARAFEPDDHDFTEEYGAAVATRLQAKIKAKPVQAQVRVFTRTGLIDGDRSHLIVEEAWLQWRHRPSTLQLRAGWQLLNWTATEAFHPADVINSRNLDSNVENPEKLGEPMVSARVKVASTLLTAYYMPLRTAPIYPGRSSRLSFLPRALPLTLQRPDPQVSHQFAAHIARTFGSADLAVHAIHHDDRSQPTFDVDLARLTATPRLHRVTQLGLTYAHALDEWVVKLEAAHRIFEVDAQPTHTQVAGGLEWGWGYDDAGEGTVLLEGQVVIGGDTDAERKRLHPFQRDVLVGYRHDFQDVAGTELLVGCMVDLEDEQVLANVNFKRRLSGTFTVEASLRAIHAPDGDPLQPVGLQTLHDTRYATLTLRHHF